MKGKHYPSFFISIVLTFILSFYFSFQVKAAIFNPNSTLELIDAINIANTNTESDGINLSPGTVYTITGMEPGVPFVGLAENNGLPIILSEDIMNSMIAGNTSPSGNNCQPLSMDAGVNDNGGNISDDNTDLCSSFFNASFNAATMLGLLDDNGGATLTHALMPTAGPSNPAIDLILQADCTRTNRPGCGHG